LSRGAERGNVEFAELAPVREYGRQRRRHLARADLQQPVARTAIECRAQAHRGLCVELRRIGLFGDGQAAVRRENGGEANGLHLNPAYVKVRARISDPAHKIYLSEFGCASAPLPPTIIGYNHLSLPGDSTLNDLQDFLRLSYAELEELNLCAKDQRMN